MIVVKLSSGGRLDLAPLRKALAEQVAGASARRPPRLGRPHAHHGAAPRWSAGIGVLVLVLAATVLSVTFATRGAMATNRPIVEVLHFIGAKSGFIAGQFQRHFLLLGLKGGVIGGGAAMLLFALAGIARQPELGHRRAATKLAALFGSFSLGWAGYVAIVAPDPADRRGHGGRLAAHRQPHPGNRRIAPAIRRPDFAL